MIFDSWLNRRSFFIWAIVPTIIFMVIFSWSCNSQHKIEPAPVAGDPLAEKGRLVAKGAGCFACHSVDGTKLVGPTWKGLYGQKRKFSNVSIEVIADDAYIRESIESPSAKIVAGYSNQMPVFKGILSAEQIDSIVAYIKSLK